MGRSKFPGKPSKHTHRKRVNVLPPTGDLTNIAESSTVTVTAISQENKQEDEVEENEGESALNCEESRPIRRRLCRKINASLRKDARKRSFIAKLRNKGGIKVNQNTRNNTLTKSLVRKDNANLAGKFVLPTRSVHSSRVIKPNKRFIDLNDSLTVKKKVLTKRQPKPEEASAKEQKENEEGSSETDKTAFTNGHRVILRQARLKLPNQTSCQGPFSTKPHNGPGTIICGVCGAVRYYRFVKQARKFNIYSCESCRKFISKQIKRQSVNSKSPNNCLVCQKGQGTCYVPPIVRSQHWKITKCAYRSRCPACWLKMCLRAYHLPPNLKQNLTQLLPKNMRSIDLTFNNTLPPLLWQKNLENPMKLVNNETTNVKQRPIRFKSQKTPVVPPQAVAVSDIKRQKIDLKGPRVKHVCRSASIVLGQPLATFTSDTEKKCDTPEQSTDDTKLIESGSKNSSIKISPDEQNTDKTKINDVSKDVSELLLRKEKLKNTPSSSEIIEPTLQKENLIQNGIYLDYSGELNQEENLKFGFSIVSSEKFPMKAVCYLCGSGGRESMLVCSVCCEPYHTFCLDKTYALPPKITNVKEYHWTCLKCTKCSDCNVLDRSKVRCPKCSNIYHPECFNPRWNPSFPLGKPTICKECMKCRGCGTSYNVRFFPGNLPLCLSCTNKKKFGMSCPICQHAVDDNKCCSKMLECMKCKKWIHSHCEGLAGEKYEIFKHLPHSVEYVCKCCSDVESQFWRSALFYELFSLFEDIFKQLSRNKTARSLLKRNRIVPVKSRKFTFSNDVDVDNNNLTDVNKIYSFEENERLEHDTLKAANQLLDIKNKLIEYNSVRIFNKDMLEALKSAKSDELLDFYKKIFQENFPWFTSSFQDDCEVSVEFTPSYESHYKYENVYEILPVICDDTRMCVLCKKIGDGLNHEESRLLYCGNDVWIHANCAYWSTDIYEEIDNNLQNVQLTIKKSLNLKCSHCAKPGASIHCSACNNEVYHFLCAKKAGCCFSQLTKACFCPKHPSSNQKYIIKTDKGFKLQRSIFVEREDKNRIRSEIKKVQYLVGSLSVTNLGKIEPILSDNPEALIPMGFVCTRLFWSTVEPWKLVPYTITTSVQNPNCNTLTVDKNFTVDHTLGKAEVNKILRELSIWQREQENDIESDDEVERNGADLLSPELTDTILEDLPHDILDGISVQDIFPNFAYDDMLNLENSNTESIAEENIETELKSTTKSKSELAQVKLEIPKSRSTSQRSCSLTLSCKLDSSLAPAIKKRKIATRENNVYYQLLQVDGNCDDSSSSECGSPTGYVTTDAWGNYTSDEPVTCEKCHCTYRTQASYKRHLDSCEVLCTSESDSENMVDSEENLLKYPTTTIVENATVMVETAQPVLISSYESFQSEVRTSVVNGQGFISTAKSAELLTLPQPAITHTVEQKPLIQTVPVNTVPPISLHQDITESSLEQTYTISQPALTISDPSAITLPNNFCVNPTVPICVNQQLSGIQVNQTLQNNIPIQQNSIQVNPMTSLINHSNQVQSISINPSGSIALNQPQQAPITINQIAQDFQQSQPVAIQSVPYNNVGPVLNNQFTLHNGKLIANPLVQTMNVPGTQWVQKVNKPTTVIAQKQIKSRVRSRAIAAKRSFDDEAIILPSSNPGQVIVQHLPSTNFVPFVDAFQQQTGQNVQYVATLAPQVNTVPQPLVQIQPDNNIISIVPGLQPTMIIQQQPRVIENQLVLDSNGTLGWSQVSQPQTVQPVYYGFETIVQNTVMQSQQFLPTTVPGVLTANSSYSTTTQVFQTSKLEPVLDVSSNSFVLVNPGSLVNSQVDIPQYSQTQPTTIMPSHATSLVYSQSSPQKSLTVPTSAASNSITLPTTPFVHEHGIPTNIVTPIPKPPTSQNRPMSRVLPMPTNNMKSPKTTFTEDKKGFFEEPLLKKAAVHIKFEDTKNTVKEPVVKMAGSIAKVKPKKLEILNYKILKPSNPTMNKTSLRDEKHFDIIEKHPKVEVCSAISEAKQDLYEQQYKTLQLIDQEKYLKLESSALTHDDPKMDIINTIEKRFNTLDPSEKSFDMIKLSNKKFDTLSAVEKKFDHIEFETRLLHTNQKIANPVKKDDAINSFEKQMEPVRSIVETGIENNNKPVFQTKSDNVGKDIGEKIPAIKDVIEDSSKELVTSTIASDNTKSDASLKLIFQKQAQDGTYKISNNVIKQPAIIAPLRTMKPQNIIPANENKLEKVKKLEDILVPKPPNASNKKTNDGSPSILYTVETKEGFKYSSNSVSDCWSKVLQAVQSARAAHNMPPLPTSNNKFMKSVQILGLKSGHLKYLIEQLPGASKCKKYKPMFNFTPHPEDLEEITGHTFGSARCRPYANRSIEPYDMFSWLSSKHRQPFNVSIDSQIIQSRRVNNFPMAMKFRNLKIMSKWSVGVYRSNIHGRGLFCLRDIEAGEMVIEYAGEVIRSVLTDKREKLYNSKGIGCYMFRVDDNFVVDATMKGNAARFINHSCDPNCYSKVIEVLGHKHIVIFALRKIISGEELTYDYKFPFEEDKIPCTCGAKRCRKFLN